MIAQGKRHVATGSSILESGGDADSENGWVIGVRATRREVIGQSHWFTTDIAGTILKGGGCAWEYGREGAHGGELEDSTCLDGGLMNGREVGDGGRLLWVAEDMLRARVYRSGEGDRQKEEYGGNHGSTTETSCIMYRATESDVVVQKPKCGWSSSVEC